ncbi:MAG: Gfo/Idh/MocA family oxidoreductase, partial [Clostridia bacterium]|nr:Gfo/Idh/MocA family oxidoreductase [Clostridia bacterium]
YLASPTRYHEEQARLFLQNGKHVLCEKPIALSLSEYQSLCALADEKGLVYMEAMMNGYVPELNLLEQKIAELGGAVSARLDFSQRSSKLDAFLRGEVASSFSKESGGALNDLGVYPIRLAIRLFGKVEEVQASAKKLHNGADGSGAALLCFRNVIVSVTYSKLCESAVRSEILCQNGAITIGLTSRLTGVTCRNSGGIIASGAAERGFAESITHELTAFIKAVNGEGKKAYHSNREVTYECVRVMQCIRAQTC